MRRFFITLLASLFIAPGTEAIASDFANGFYFGASGGVADNLDVCDEIGNPSSPRPCEDSDFGWQIFAGWQFLKWVSIEGGWTDLGQSSHQDVSGTSTQSETEGLQINAVATVPVLEKIGLYFKAGAYVWDLEVSQTDILGARSEISDQGVDYVLGAGLRFPLVESLGVNIEYQRFEDVGDTKTGSFNANLLTAGLLFRF